MQTAPDTTNPWLQGLNPAQREAVQTLSGPLLVLSGAGTGKTRVLTSRLAELVATGTAKPWNILAVTFTNKAAREMKMRVSSMVGPMAEQVWLGTFHALAARMLRRHADLVGLRSDFTILDMDDQTRLLKQLMEVEGLDAKRWPARQLGGVIQRWKDRGLTPDKVGIADAGDLANGRMRDLYQAYQARLLALNAVDFGDLLLHVLTIFQAHPDVLAEYHNRITHIMVDEYQDTNVAQYLWLRLLTGPDRNLCCVGDDDQSIYGWRGAEVGNILRFEKDFPGAHVVRLEQNYRSTPQILAAAANVMRGNADRLGLGTRASFLQGDFADPQAGGAGFDIVLCNPPYIPAAQIATLAPEVALYDPHRALDGGEDGLVCWRAVLPRIAAGLSPQGRALVEIGAGQEEAVATLARQAGLAETRRVRDLGGIVRCLVFRADS